MIDWYAFAVISLLLLGTQRFFYKVAAERGCPTEWVMFWFMLTVTVMSFGLFLLQEHHIPHIGYWVAVSAINGTAFLIATVSHIEALKYVPGNITYPLIQLNVAVVALFSLLCFRDHLSLSQGMGLLLSLIAMVVLKRQIEEKAGASPYRRRGLVFILLALFGGAAASISSKFAAVYTDKSAFMGLSYFIGMVGSIGIKKAVSSSQRGNGKMDALGIGLVMGLFNFAGFYAFLLALEQGPLSLIAAMAGMHFVISVVLSALIYKEKMTKATVTGIFLTAFSILLLRL